MKRLLSAIIALSAGLCLSAQTLPVIPAPAEVSFTKGVADTAKELKVRIGGKSFARKTAALAPFAREEAYRLALTPKGYIIEANTATGRDRALETLRQIPEGTGACEIFDYPRFPYRGFMLDISRHFRDKEFILKQLPALASVKINVLHLHLTDDAGWRIQIDSYPELTRMAAWRIGRTWEEWAYGGQLYAGENTAGASGGFLSKDDVREIVAAASRYHITVIPEIEMPGHSAEVVKAYPETGCTPDSREFCPGKEATFALLESVLDEVMELFPSTYIHIGGDEASKRDWHDCPDCRARMAAEGLDSVEQLQSWLIRRIERYLVSHGRRLIGWDEILEGGLSPDATVMSWRGTEGGIEAMKQGHDAIMTPGSYCYINNAQDAPIFEPKGQGGYLPLDAVYAYDPAEGIPEEILPHLLGIQANLWQEYVPSENHSEYMMYPRLAAIAETGWSPRGKRSDFRTRAQRWSGSLSDGSLTGNRYSVFDLAAEKGERRAFSEGIRHKAVGKKVIYNIPWHPSYKAASETTLTDGLGGGWSFGDGRWQGFLSDVDVTVDMGEKTPLHFAGATFMCQPGPGIFLPARIEIYTSDDGIVFSPAAVIPVEVSDQVLSNLFFGAPLNVSARYLRIKAYRTREWLFVDEIVIN